MAVLIVSICIFSEALNLRYIFECLQRLVKQDNKQIDKPTLTFPFIYDILCVHFNVIKRNDMFVCVLHIGNVNSTLQFALISMNVRNIKFITLHSLSSSLLINWKRHYIDFIISFMLFSYEKFVLWVMREFPYYVLCTKRASFLKIRKFHFSRSRLFSHRAYWVLWQKQRQYKHFLFNNIDSADTAEPTSSLRLLKVYMLNTIYILQCASHNFHSFPCADSLEWSF